MFFILTPTQTQAGALKPLVSEKFRFEITANSFRDGESIEAGFLFPHLFKFKTSSRHFWSPFLSIGMTTFNNVAFVDKEKLEEEVINLEAIIGLFAFGRFYKDFIFQYGKIGLDHIILDDGQFKKNDSSTGFLLESGLEFQSSLAKWGINSESPIAIHLGLRWRFGHGPLEDVQGSPDLIEGISFVIGSRLSF